MRLWNSMLTYMSELFRGKEITKRIHDSKNEYASITGSSLLRTDRMQKRIEKTVTYQIGLSTGGAERGL